jgi:hypothetical protein
MHNEIWNQMGTNQLPVNSTANQLGSGQPQVNQFAASQVPMNLLTVEVKYSVQATERSVRLSTLVSSP